MQDQRESGLPFMKMHGLGNDFVVIDTRTGPVSMTADLARAIGDRHHGVGFDQLALIAAAGDADLTLTFYNADGSFAEACGNATRCVARWEMTRTGRDRLTIRTARGILFAEDAGGGLTRVNMGAPKLGWRDIPLAREVDTAHLPIEGDAVATSMGNPHCTYFVDDMATVDLATFGPGAERHPLFPQRANVEIVQVLARDAIRLRIWERGTGVTLASGSCSCAAAVASARRGLTDPKVTVHLDGGELEIDWRDDGVWMTGPTARVFDGVLSRDWLEAV